MDTLTQPQPLVVSPQSKILNRKIRAWVWNKHVGPDVRNGKCHACHGTIDIDTFKYMKVPTEIITDWDTSNGLVPVCPRCFADPTSLNILNLNAISNYTVTNNIPVVIHFNRFKAYYNYCIDRKLYSYPLEMMLTILVIKCEVTIMNTHIYQIAEILTHNSNENESIRANFFLQSILQYVMDNQNSIVAERLFAINMVLNQIHTLPNLSGDSDVLKAIYAFHLVNKYYQMSEIKSIDIHKNIATVFCIDLSPYAIDCDPMIPFTDVIKSLIHNLNSYEDYVRFDKIIIS
jgi:hypothetical protein